MKKLLIFILTLALIFCIPQKSEAAISKIGDSQDFNYIGDVQTYIIPLAGKYKLEVYGAEGKSVTRSGVNNPGGKGGYARGTITFNAGDIIYVYVGGNGGYNGGGAGGYFTSWGTPRYAGNGGGATDIRIGGTDFTNRVIVAGGGGGAGYNTSSYAAGDGGGDSGGGSGTLGRGDHGDNISSGPTGGGGGGYYGGSGGSSYNRYLGGYICSGGGGGSGYVSPTLEDPAMSNGVQLGNGFARITYLGIPDTIPPALTLTQNITSLTNQNVIITATATDNTAIKMIVNPDASWVSSMTTTYSVSTNGTYTFSAIDTAGNITTKSISVSNIDKTAPTATVSYSTTTPTNGNVIATITPSEPIIITNNSGQNKYTFTANGNFIFSFRDAAGNTGSVTASVSNIDKIAPTGSLSIESRNGNTTTTDDINVKLNISASDIGLGINGYAIRNTNDFTGATYTPYYSAVKIDWVILGTSGTNTVYIKFIDRAGNTLQSSASIKYEKICGLDKPILSANIFTGEDITLTATGTNIADAAYRVFYTNEYAPPSITNGTTPGIGWTDSGIVGDRSALTITGGTSISGKILLSQLMNLDATYITVKVWAASSTGSQSQMYSDGCNISDDGVTSIGRVNHLQIIHLQDLSKDIIVSDPNTPAGAYTADELSSLNRYNTFTDDSLLRYRLEFDAINGVNTLSDVKIYLDFNYYNEDKIEFKLEGQNGTPIDSMKLYKKQSDGTYTLITDLSNLYTKLNGRNLYQVSLGDIIKNNGAGRYIIDYTSRVYVTTNANYGIGETLLIQNKADIKVYFNDSIYSNTVNQDRPGKKFYINTNIWNGRVQTQ